MIRVPRGLRTLAVIPAFGHAAMTRDVVRDLARERHLCDVVVVDNMGDYEPLGPEEVLVPGRNLGWAGGINHGSRAGGGYGWLLWLNNDTRLCPNFVRSLVEAAVVTKAGIVAPFYDCHWAHQRVLAGPADSYRPSRKHYRTAFVDGTCMLVSRRAVLRLGLLDDLTFAPLGWGAEIDYCLRAGRAGLDVVATRQAYLHHLRGITATAMFGGQFGDYVANAYPRSVEGLVKKWGPGWMGEAGIDPDTFQTGTLDESQRKYALALSGWPTVRRYLQRFRRSG